MPAKYQEIRLNEIFNLNDSGKFVLPNFQRDFVWDIEQQKKLLASFLVGLPVGSILVLDGSKDDFACRKLCYPEAPENISADCYYLLDGQQRISCFRSFFSDLFAIESDWKHAWDKLYKDLKNRWCLHLTHESDDDILGRNSLKFKPDDIYNYEPSQLVELIKVIGVKKTVGLDHWTHPGYRIFDTDGTEFTGNKRKDKISEKAADLGYVPLYELFSDPDRGLHADVLQKIAEKIKHKLQARIDDHELTYFEVLGDIDGDIEQKVTDCKINDIETAWLTLKINWATEVRNYLKMTINQNIFQIILPSSEVGRAIATFSSINEGGTKLDVYDLVVARAAKQQDLDSLTQRLCGFFSSELVLSDALLSTVMGDKPSTWNPVDFGILENNVPSSTTKDMYLNNLSVLTHCIVRTEEPKIDHIKITKILALNHSDINDNTENCINALKRAYSFLCMRCGLVSINDLPYKLMVIPIALVLLDDNNWNSNKVINRLEYWYWLSVFSGRYRESQNEVCIDDYNKILKWIVDDINPFTTNKERILNYEGYSKKEVLLRTVQDPIPRPIDKGILQYILSNQPRDFIYDIRINSWDVASAKKVNVNTEVISISVQDHHIIPLDGAVSISDTTSKLRKDKDNIMNSPLNRTYILSKTNQDIGAKNITDYMVYVNESSTWHHCIPKASELAKLSGETSPCYYVRLLTSRYDEIRKTIMSELDRLE